MLVRGGVLRSCADTACDEGYDNVEDFRGYIVFVKKLWRKSSNSCQVFASVPRLGCAVCSPKAWT